ncbi:MAG: aminopeptidase P N-terminal domain-containing protein [Gemmatimonadales bacterium]
MKCRTLAVLLACSVRLGAQITPAEYAARRAALVKALPGEGVLLVLGAAEPKENYLNFWQAESFNYLTGFLEPDAALVIVHRGGTERSLLFVQPRDPAQEVWTGARLGVDGVARTFAIEGRDAESLRTVLDSLLASGGSLFTVGDFTGRSRGGDAARGTALSADDQFVDAFKAAHPNVTVRDVSPQVSALRGRKSAAELALLRTAAKISALAHKEVLHLIAPEVNEFEVQALAEYTFRRNGADGPAYGSIVGSGPNSTTLHYNRDDRFMRAGEVVTMDMAAYYGGYAADLTRTVPVSGTFTAEQKDIYRIVYDAQQAAERQVRTGGSRRTMSDSAGAGLRAGLARLGLIESPGATFECGARSCSQLSLYYMHSLGHAIGLDVHDTDQSDAGGGGVLREGSAFTIEPGIYVRANTVDLIPDTPKNAPLRARIAAAVRRYANIGVRIEDDYIVTATGFERITEGAPREIEEIEREMARREPPRGRDAAMVEGYRKVRP